MNIGELQCLFCCASVNEVEIVRTSKRKAQVLTLILNKFILSKTALSSLKTNFIEEPVPFCTSCRFEVVKLCQLTDRLRNTEFSINRTIDKLTALIVNSDVEKRNYFENTFAFQHSNVRRKGMYSSFRNLVIEKFDPKVTLERCDNDEPPSSVSSDDPLTQEMRTQDLEDEFPDVISGDVYENEDAGSGLDWDDTVSGKSCESKDGGLTGDDGKTGDNITGDVIDKTDPAIKYTGAIPLITDVFSGHVSNPIPANSITFSQVPAGLSELQENSSFVDPGSSSSLLDEGTLYVLDGFQYRKTDGGYVCCTCSLFCSGMHNNVRRHIYGAHIRKYMGKCEICGMETKRLSQHMALNHLTKSQSLVCSTCGKKFKSARARDSHVECEHPAGTEDSDGDDTTRFSLGGFDYRETSKGFKCCTCFKVYPIGPESSRAKNVRRHIYRQHFRKYSGTCEICKREVPVVSDHMAHFHAKGTEKWDCPVCNQGFKAKSDMLRHVKRQHTNPRPVPHVSMNEVRLTNSSFDDDDPMNELSHQPGSSVGEASAEDEPETKPVVQQWNELSWSQEHHDESSNLSAVVFKVEPGEEQSILPDLEDDVVYKAPAVENMIGVNALGTHHGYEYIETDRGYMCCTCNNNKVYNFGARLQREENIRRHILRFHVAYDEI